MEESSLRPCAKSTESPGSRSFPDVSAVAFAWAAADTIITAKTIDKRKPFIQFFIFTSCSSIKQLKNHTQ
jgi:hypothetical protein